MCTKPQRWLLAISLLVLAPAGAAQRAHASEHLIAIPTYPFSEPNPVPILVSDYRLYPYHSFEGYSTERVTRRWRVVTLENSLIRIEILPQVGGKVFGATIKQTGRHFIYRNDVLKFRNVALRGPWTSGGIEFNFGVFGHAPTTATPVDYVFRDNDDGSASCIIGMMDLPSRTQWRVEIRLAAGSAAFETRVTWSNPTPLEAPYYTWMTAAASASSDLVMTIPGTRYLEHSGVAHPWPIDSAGRNLAHYDENDFGGNKSYHVVGQRGDFFGGYYGNSDFGFVHAAPQSDLPGRKLWIWALSRQGGIWERLLTDHAGQYVEFQAGRMLVQYAPSGRPTPIRRHGFEPGRTDHWVDTWYPVVGLGGLTDASARGAIHVVTGRDSLHVGVMSNIALSDTLLIVTGADTLDAIPLDLTPLRPTMVTLDVGTDTGYRVVLPHMGIDYDSDPGASAQDRTWRLDSTSRSAVPEVLRATTEARQLVLGRHYPEARIAFEAVLARHQWDPDALLGMARLEYRRGNIAAGLVLVRRLLRLDTQDPESNFAAGLLLRAAGRPADAADAFGWAARSSKYRVVANLQLAEMALAAGNLKEAEEFVHQVRDHDRDNLSAREIEVLIARNHGDDNGANAIGDSILAVDPLDHFVAAERYLAAPTPERAESLLATMQGEYPDQTILELALGFNRRGAPLQASRLLERFGSGPISLSWQAWLVQDPALLHRRADLELVFPYRRETIPILRWAAANRPDWTWQYLLALNLWGRDRGGEAARIMTRLDSIDWAPALVARASLLQRELGRDPAPDLRRAIGLAPGNRIIRIALIDELQSRHDWDAARTVSAAGRRLFTSDFTIAILHATSLLYLGHADSTLAVLRTTEVLPSEHSRGVHALYVDAHLTAALDAIDAGRYSSARAHLTAAREWPEHLGEGRPYNPDEAEIDYLSGMVALRLDQARTARAAFEAVIKKAGHGGERGSAILAEVARARLEHRPTPARSEPARNDRRSALISRILEIAP